MIISKEKVVYIHYELKSDNGDLIDSSKVDHPLAFIQGAGNIIEGLERALEGKKVGDNVKVIVSPENAYGFRNEELIQIAPLSKFDNPENVAVGNRFYVQGPKGESLAVVIKTENEDITIDLNHPLAGETLHFDVAIVEVRQATIEELEHGHAHGKGGHEH